jgi:lipase chaperone LimK
MDLLEEYKHFSGVQTPEEAIDMLKQIQAFRRQRLGQELADRLFGTDVKAKEYAFRRAAIVRDNTLYGREKEERLAELNKDMWGDESAAVDAHRNAYNQYQETLQIYQKDLDEAASEAARQKKLRQLREEHFSPEVVAKFEEIDQQMDEAAEREKTYREQAGAIESNEALSEAEKEKRIRNLQSEVFGEDAAAFRRREAIRKGREEMKKRSPLTVEDLPQAGQQ